MDVVRVEAKRYDFDPQLIAAVIYKESRNRNQVCRTGSHGLMQIQLRPRSCKKSMDAAVRLGLYDPRTNIRKGVELMAWWRSWWRKHHSEDGYHWLLHYNQGFGRCPKNKLRCKKSEKLPVRTGRIGEYANRVLKIYRKLKKKNVPEV
jgi:membrane-bound lytic murein transglycosylase MltF